MAIETSSATEAMFMPDHGVTLVNLPAGHAFEEPLAETVTQKLGSARIWQVSSTSTGGGVAELLWSGLANQQSLGVPVNWLIADAKPDFFQLTKRIHHGLHGRSDRPFDEIDAQLYHEITKQSAEQLKEFITPGDLAILHDPQTAGIAPHLLSAGVRVAWRCHIGTRISNSVVGATWEFLRPYLEKVPQCVFTVASFAPHYLSADQVKTILPSIDPASPKNVDMSADACRMALASIGLLTSPESALSQPIGYVVQDEPLPEDAPIVTQVSRWDPLKDMPGVLRAFAEGVAWRSSAHLLLVGPDPADIPDDPEGTKVFGEVRAMRDSLPFDVRRRVHLAVLSLREQTANAVVVNAIQRYSTIVVQKSLEEGFGLTITEAMWKSRPIVASAVGGIVSQLTDGVDALLVEPTELSAFADAIYELLSNPARASMLGKSANLRCSQDFLASRELRDYLFLYTTMLEI